MDESSEKAVRARSKWAHTKSSARFGACLSTALLIAAVILSAIGGWWSFTGVVLAFLSGGTFSKIAVEHQHGLIKNDD